MRVFISNQPTIDLPGGDVAVIGTAIFSATGGTISNVTVKGVCSGVTRAGAGDYHITLSPNQTQFVVSAIASGDGVPTACETGGGDDINSSLSSIEVATFTAAGPGTLRDPGTVMVAIIKM